jgi:hypothetical protein
VPPPVVSVILPVSVSVGSDAKVVARSVLKNCADVTGSVDVTVRPINGSNPAPDLTNSSGSVAGTNAVVDAMTLLPHFYINELPQLLPLRKSCCVGIRGGPEYAQVANPSYSTHNRDSETAIV